MKIVITGGHFSPAYAVLQKLKDKNDILVIGRKYAFEGDNNETFEYKVCIKENIPFVNLTSGRIQRKFTKHTFSSLIKFPKGTYSAFRILRKFQPDVVVCFGGYIALPVAFAASALNIPIVLHEQTQKAGLASKIIGKFAKVICISFESSRRYFRSEKTILTGNPIRDEILTAGKKLDISKDLPNIYITGGSTGAHFINDLIFGILSNLLVKSKVFIQTGNSREYHDYEKFEAYYKSLSQNMQKNLVVKKFFEVSEISFLFKKVDLVISRAGINTVLELIANRTVSLLIPLDYGQVNEQKDNAILFQKTGLGRCLEQKEITSTTILGTISDMIEKRGKYKIDPEKIKEYIHLDATDKIIEQIYLYGGTFPKTQSFKIS